MIQKRIRRLFASQLTIKHKLKLTIPNENEIDAVFELFINEMLKQLNRKLIKQSEDLKNENNKQSPLFIQRKQLQKDIDEFQIFDQRKDLAKIEQIIQRIEYAQIFNQKQHVQINIPSKCSFQVCSSKSIH